MQTDPKAIRAILTSDWHLSHKPPIARSCEKNWYGVMRSYLFQLTELREKLNTQSKRIVPIICAGDIVNRWSEPPELINFALETMPVIYAVAGNHDLPNHNYKEINKSCYWTLVSAGRVINLPPNDRISIGDIRLHAFPCGFPPIDLQDPHDLVQEVAVVHDYVWTQDTGYPDAPEEKRLKRYKKRLAGFNVAVVGDNHKTFLKYIGNLTVFNCGSLLRRNIDQVDHKPCVGVLKYDNTVEIVYLDTSRDKFIDKRELKKAEANLQVGEFLDSLKDLKENTIDFEQAVLQALEAKKVSQEVKKLVLTALGV